MKVNTLDNFEYTLRLSSNPINRAKLREDRSAPHLAARQLLGEIFPTYQLIEEVPISIYKNLQLYLDFFIPLRMLAIEVHGEQHYKYVYHFHGSKLNFLKQKKNDGLKEEWCDLNNIELVVLKWDKQIEWENLIGR
jgi:hypothetical protein